MFSYASSPFSTTECSFFFILNIFIGDWLHQSFKKKPNNNEGTISKKSVSALIVLHGMPVLNEFSHSPWEPKLSITKNGHAMGITSQWLPYLLPFTFSLERLQACHRSRKRDLGGY